jgi:hypothetical protein
MNHGKMKARRTLLLLGFLLIFTCAGVVRAQTTAFTYQGRLTDGGTAATGSYDLQFALWDSNGGGAQIGATQTMNAVAVSGGIFTVTLDFGVTAFPGADRFLEIGVRPAGGGAFTTLSPRQQISSTPYAIRTLTAASADSATTALTATNATQLGGVDDASEPASNTIDDAQSFVCQHYHDFLNRQPDSSGLSFWTSNITSCGSDAACIEVKRINVSGAFYLSIEFQQTGYLVERLYKTAYGDSNQTSTFGGAHSLAVPIVSLNEFLSDSQNIGQGVVVGQTGWEQQLENNKQAFVSEFLQRARFQTAFPNGLPAAQYVDTLNANAGKPLSQTERDQLVNDLSAGAKTRAQVLRAIAEHPNLVNAEFNRAFVLMQFFGYLRRNPNDPQDSDYTGYDFWLTKLNQFFGNFQNAEMVKAFLSSSEYRQRFGP